MSAKHDCWRSARTSATHPEVLHVLRRQHTGGLPQQERQSLRRLRQETRIEGWFCGLHPFGVLPDLAAGARAGKPRRNPARDPDLHRVETVWRPPAFGSNAHCWRETVKAKLVAASSVSPTHGMSQETAMKEQQVLHDGPFH